MPLNRRYFVTRSAATAAGAALTGGAVVAAAPAVRAAIDEAGYEVAG